MSDKIHPPTPRKRQRAKEQGRGPRSGEVVSAGLLLAATALLAWTGPTVVENLMTRMTRSLQQPVIRLTDPWQPYREIADRVVGVGWVLLPLLIMIPMCATTLSVLQSGLRVNASRLVPSPGRLSPATRLRSMFQPRSLGGFAILLLKLATLCAVFVFFVHETLPQILRLPGIPLPEIGPIIFDTLIDCCLWTGATLLAFASVDYAWSWWQFERELMMTEQELREEMRDQQRTQLPASASRSQPVQAVT